jgi:hypothetical protein
VCVVVAGLGRGVGVSLTVSPRQRYQLKIPDAESLLWANQGSAAWPLERLGAIVAPGSYDLSLTVDVLNGATEHRLASNSIHVGIEK